MKKTIIYYYNILSFHLHAETDISFLSRMKRMPEAAFAVASVAIVLIFMLTLSQSQVFAYEGDKIKKTGQESLFAENADRLSCIEISAQTQYLPDFSAFQNLEEIKTDPDNPYYTSEEGVLYSKDKKILICYPKSKPGSRFTVPEGVSEILSGAFYENNNLRKVILPSTLEKIGANPFAGCQLLKEISVSAQNKYFCEMDGCLYNIDKTKLIACPAYIISIDIAPSVTTIGYSAFSGCRRIKSISLPDGIDKIESMAFSGCSSLSSVTIPKNVNSINVSCFTGCSSLTEINAENSDYFKSEDGILYSFDMIDLICCPNGKSGIVQVPDGVLNILNGAFDNCTKITRIKLPQSISYISRAFSNCSSLLNIEFPQNQTIIEYGTLSGCFSLEWVYLPNNVVIIQNDALPDTDFKILCDEDSFAEFYAADNLIPYAYKYKVTLGEKVLSLSDQPYKAAGDVYLPVTELLEAMDGSARFTSGSMLYAQLGNLSVKFDFSRVERTINNQTEFISVQNIKYEKDEIYLSADDFSEIFNLKIEQEPYWVKIDY